MDLCTKAICHVIMQVNPSQASARITKQATKLMEKDKCLTKIGGLHHDDAMKNVSIARIYLDLGEREDKMALRVNFPALKSREEIQRRHRGGFRGWNC